MYGTNAARGFIPVAHENGSAWNNQLNASYKIISGYNYNIGQGELVYICNATPAGSSNATQGFLCTYAQLTAATQVVSAIGVFWGCDYPLQNNFPITGPLGHKSWVAGTVTQDGNPATAFIITDPTVVYTVQSNGPTGFTMATANQMFYNIALENGTLGTAPGGTLNTDGTSQMMIDLANSGRGTQLNTAPIRTISLDPDSNNPIAAYNNAYCMIQNGVISSGGLTAAQHS